MTVKFTRTGVGNEAGNEELLFEFLDHELPEEIAFNYETELGTSKFVGSLQTNQIQGVYLQPIEFSGTFYGMQNDENTGALISAKERYDQLGLLQGRIIKFWYEGIKQIVIIKSLTPTFKNYLEVDYKITLQPHDIQYAVKPSRTFVFEQNSVFLNNFIDGTPETGNPVIDAATNDAKTTMEDLTGRGAGAGPKPGDTSTSASDVTSAVLDAKAKQDLLKQKNKNNQKKNFNQEKYATDLANIYSNNLIDPNLTTKVKSDLQSKKIPPKTIEQVVKKLDQAQKTYRMEKAVQNETYNANLKKGIAKQKSLETIKNATSLSQKYAEKNSFWNIAADTLLGTSKTGNKREKKQAPIVIKNGVKYQNGIRIKE